LIKQYPLDLGFFASDQPRGCAGIELRIKWVASNVLNTHRNSVAHFVEIQATEGSLIHETHLALVVGEGDPHPQVLFIVCGHRLHEHLATHPQMHYEGEFVFARQRQPQILAAPASAPEGISGERAFDGSSSAGTTANGSRVEHLGFGDRSSSRPPVDSAPDDLYLG
jgi:hypothetical protein